VVKTLEAQVGQYTAVCIAAPYVKVVHSTSLFKNKLPEHAVDYRTGEFLKALLPGNMNIKYESTEIWNKKE
jgi:hypothetical protein